MQFLFFAGSPRKQSKNGDNGDFSDARQDLESSAGLSDG